MAAIASRGPPNWDQLPWREALPYHWDAASTKLLSLTAVTTRERMRIGHQIRWNYSGCEALPCHKAEAHRFYPVLRNTPAILFKQREHARTAHCSAATTHNGKEDDRLH